MPAEKSLPKGVYLRDVLSLKGCIKNTFTKEKVKSEATLENSGKICIVYVGYACTVFTPAALPLKAIRPNVLSTGGRTVPRRRRSIAAIVLFVGLPASGSKGFNLLEKTN